MMRAVQVSAPGADFELVRREVPVPKESEVLIRVEACGISAGGRARQRGPLAGHQVSDISGHEVVGVVEA